MRFRFLPTWWLGSKGKWIEGERDSEKQRQRETELLVILPFMTYFGSHTVTSAVLCWLRQSQKLLRFKAREYKPHHSIRRESMPHCKKE